MIERVLVALVLSTLALGGCTLGQHDLPRYRELGREKIRLADDIHLARDGWPAARWWTRFNDSQLNALVTRALAESPTIIVARTRVSQAKAVVEQVRSGTYLRTIALAAIDREHVSANGFLGAYAHTQPLIGATGPWYTEGIVGMGASLNVDLWGESRSNVAASIGVQNARVAEAAAVELEIAADVAQLYYAIQTTHQLIDLLGQARAVSVFRVSAHAGRAGTGLEARTATEEARVEQLAIERSLRAARTQLVQFREALRALAGAGPDDLPELRPVPLPATLATLPPTLSYELLARRPDLQAMRWFVQASLDRVDAAKAAFFPRFDIRAFFGFNALHLGDLLRASSQQINVIPSLALPLFDRGRLNANLQAARNDSNVLIAQYNEAVVNAVRDIAVTGNQLQGLDAERDLQVQTISSVKFTESSAQAHYQRGLASLLTAVEARQPVIEEQISLLELDGLRIGQHIALIKALGGGYHAELPQGDGTKGARK
jgi:multidrug efflux system outer membrane protein